MARKEVNIFGTSFLDLLSGALGAVIILFIIVPKMSLQQQETLQELETLNVQVGQLSELMEQLENSVSRDVFVQLQQQLDDMQNTISSLSSQVERLQAENSSLRSENEELREQVRRHENIEREYEDARRRIRELEERLEEQTESDGISGGKIFGINAELGIVCIWPENVDVDLYVKNMSTGEICYFAEKDRQWGSLSEDIRTRTEGDDRYELFYQREIVPGEYQIYVNIFTSENMPWNGTPATVSCYAVLYPGKSNQKKINFRTVRLTQAQQDIYLGVLRVTNNNIYLQ